MSVARYDGLADWYETWATSEGAAAMTEARACLAELLPPGDGPAVDIGCGTGLHAETVRRRGYEVVGVDISSDQLSRARSRLPVARADAACLPLADGVAQAVVSVLTHTDLEDFGALVREAVRVLVPGGSFVYVGVHPCFVNPLAERLTDGVRLHVGYRRAGWQPLTPFTGNAVRARVGAHHLPLQELLTALLHPDAPVDGIWERGGGPVPELLAVRLRHR